MLPITPPPTITTEVMWEGTACLRRTAAFYRGR